MEKEEDEKEEQKNDENINNINNSNSNNQSQNPKKNQKIRNEITEEKLKNVGIKSLLGGNIYMKSKIANGYDLLNKKRE